MALLLNFGKRLMAPVINERTKSPRYISNHHGKSAPSIKQKGKTRIQAACSFFYSFPTWERIKYHPAVNMVLLALTLLFRTEFNRKQKTEN